MNNIMVAHDTRISTNYSIAIINLIMRVENNPVHNGSISPSSSEAVSLVQALLAVVSDGLQRNHWEYLPRHPFACHEHGQLRSESPQCPRLTMNSGAEGSMSQACTLSLSWPSAPYLFLHADSSYVFLIVYHSIIPYHHRLWPKLGTHDSRLDRSWGNWSINIIIVSGCIISTYVG